jgi:protein SCO1/2
MKTLKTSSLVVPFLIMAVLAATALGAFWLAYKPTPPIAEAATDVGYGQPSGAPAIGGPFTLQDDEGRTVTEANLVGEKYHLIFFGFANCPDVCPGMLQLMAGVEEKLPTATQAKLQFVFVSVDPARDTLAKLGAYVRGFSPSFVGWTGDKANIDAMVKNYLAYYAIAKPAVGDDPAVYNVDHSGFAYLMGPDGTYMAHFRSSDSAASLQAALEKFVK